MFGPILAQLVTLALSDRTEGRVVHADETHLEGATYPRVGVSFAWKHASLNLGYGPSLTVLRLESKREFTVLHNAVVSGLYSWERSTLSVSESFGYGEINLQQLALAGPAAQPGAGGFPTPAGGTTTPPPDGTTGGAGATPPPGTTPPPANLIRASGGVIPFLTSTTTVTLNHRISPVWLVGGGVGYTIVGSVGEEASAAFPVSKGPLAEVHASNRIDRANAANLSITTQAISAVGNNAWMATANAGWGRAWSLRTTTQLGSGVSISRNSQANGFVFWSIFPTFNASISHVVPQGRSAFGFGSAISSAPVIDPTRASVDPKLTWSVSASWGLNRFYTGLNAGTAIAIAQHNYNSAFNSVYAGFNAGFNLGAGFSVDTGVRAFWQSVGGQTTAPATYAGYLGISFAIATPLKR
jgi:hypothetical protein